MADEKGLDSILLEICKAFNSEGVEYVLIGGWAVIIHGFPRMTNDIDFLIEGSEENIKKIKHALLKVFNDNAIEEIKARDVNEYSVIRYISNEGVVVDLMAKIGEITDYKGISEHIVRYQVLNTNIPILDVEGLIKLKDTVRDKDRIDLEFLKSKLKKQK